MKPVKLGERLPLQILSADDIATNRDLLRYICRFLGYQTDLVHNGSEVLEQMSKKHYDLILLDVQMPVLDGLSAAREICRREPVADRRPKLVAVTASLAIDGPKICLAAGMDDYLAKPILPQHLHDCIERLFKDRPPVPGAPLRSANAPWVDWNHLRSMTDGLDQTHAWACVTVLRSTVNNDFELIRPRLLAACGERNNEVLAREIHALKGCVQSLGWACMSRRCTEVLTELRAVRFAGWEALPSEFDELFNISSAALNVALPSELGATAGAPAM